MRWLRLILHGLLSAALLLWLAVAALWVRSHWHWDVLFYSCHAGGFRADSYEGKLSVFVYDLKNADRSDSVSWQWFRDPTSNYDQVGPAMLTVTDRELRFGVRAGTGSLFTNDVFAGSSFASPGRWVLVPLRLPLLAAMPLGAVPVWYVAWCLKRRYGRRNRSDKPRRPARFARVATLGGRALSWIMVLVFAGTLLLWARSLFRFDVLETTQYWGEPGYRVWVNRGVVVFSNSVHVEWRGLAYRSGAIHDPSPLPLPNRVLGFAWGGLPTWEGPIQTSWQVPFWFVTLASAVPLAWLWRRRRRERVKAAWAARGCCAACGYDLRGSAGRCPECGEASRTGASPA